jgi:hypothetical protein
VLAREVLLVIAGDDVVEQAEVRGHSIRHAHIRRSGHHDAPALPTRGLQVGQHFGPIWQMRHVQLDRRCDARLEMLLATRQSARQPGDHERPALQQQDRTFDQGIRG